MKKVRITAFTALLCLLFSCDIAPEQINYGNDACNFCKMTIVDQQHAAQYVTKKGKQFKFDAIECLVNELSEKEIEKIGILLVSDYKEPGQMTSALDATYLISKEIKSPMGANLSAFESAQIANNTKDESGGELYTWTQLLKKFDAE
jgi:copper chaperone NosL